MWTLGQFYLIFLVSMIASVSVMVVTGEADTNVTGPSPKAKIGYVHSVPVHFNYSEHSCELVADSDVTLDIDKAISAGTDMIELLLYVNNSTLAMHKAETSLVYKPNVWIRSAGKRGAGLLLLRPEYGKLSLNLLEMGVETLRVNLQDRPSNCFSYMPPDEAERLVRNLAMKDFQNESVPSDGTEREHDICNLHILNENGVAEFRYYCCHMDKDMQICNYLEYDAWQNTLLVLITILKVMVFLFGPRLIPESSYRLHNVVRSFSHKLENRLKLKTVITTDEAKYDQSQFRNKFVFKKFRQMTEFRNRVKTLMPDTPYSLFIDELKLKVRMGRLLPENYAPVSLFTTIYEGFFTCGIRKKASLADCCKAKCLGENWPWSRALKALMKLIIGHIVITPWLIRVYIYFLVEDREMQMRKKAAYERNLDLYFPGSGTLYFTPLHALFIAIYVLLILQTFTIGALPKQMSEQLIFVMRKCMVDMHEMKHMEVVGWFVKLSVKPCKLYGVYGLCLGVLWIFGLPFVLLAMVVYMIPTFNLTLRLIAHFVVYMCPENTCLLAGMRKQCSELIQDAARTLEMETMVASETLEKRAHVLNSKPRRFQQLLVIFIGLISMYSILFLCIEFVALLVDVLVYTFIGLILHASKTLTYVTFIFMFAVYARDCFGIVSKTFKAFNKTLHACIAKMCVPMALYNIQRNTAVRIHSERSAGDNCRGVNTNGVCFLSPVILTTSSKSQPRWFVKNLSLFVGKKDKPMIPSRLFFNACKMDHYQAPGELLPKYLKALGEFGLVVLFLLFVTIIVFAFGDVYSFSATNQVLLTLAGGFVPLMLRRLVFKTQAVPEVDIEHQYFLACVEKEINNFQQSWPIEDIVVVEETLDNTLTDIDLLILASKEDLEQGTSSGGSSRYVSERDMTSDEEEVRTQMV